MTVSLSPPPDSDGSVPAGILITADHEPVVCAEHVSASVCAAPVGTTTG